MSTGNDNVIPFRRPKNYDPFPSDEVLIARYGKFVYNPGLQVVRRWGMSEEFLRLMQKEGIEV